MADKFSKETRSYIMSRIRSKNTKPELIMKESLKGLYLRYQPKMLGNPDFASKKHKLVVFVDGCYWHACPMCYNEPKSNKGYWVQKIKKNVDRDRKYTKKLKKAGWKVMRFWEHQVLKAPNKCREKIAKAKET